MNSGMDLIDFVISTELTNIRNSFKQDLKKAKPLVFCNDPVKDKKLIKEHIDAFDLIIKYFS